MRSKTQHIRVLLKEIEKILGSYPNERTALAAHGLLAGWMVNHAEIMRLMRQEWPVLDRSRPGISAYESLSGADKSAESRVIPPEDIGSFPRESAYPNSPSDIGTITHDPNLIRCQSTHNTNAMPSSNIANDSQSHLMIPGGAGVNSRGSVEYYDKSMLNTQNNQLSSNGGGKADNKEDKFELMGDKLCEPTKPGDKVGEPVSEWEVEEKRFEEDERVIGDAVKEWANESQEEEVIEIKVIGECINSRIMAGEMKGGRKVNVRKMKGIMLRVGATYRCRWSGVGELWEVVG